MNIKAISLMQPWASLIAIGAKKIETRGPMFNVRYRGPLAIHASLNMPGEVGELCDGYPFFDVLKASGFPTRMFYDDEVIVRSALPKGCVLCIVDLVDVRLTTKVGGGDPDWLLSLSEQEYFFGDFSGGRCALFLENVRPLSTPIPARGHLSLWDWEVPEDVRL